MFQLLKVRVPSTICLAAFASFRRRPRAFSTRLGQVLILLLVLLHAGLLGSLRDHRDGRSMFAFRVGQIEVMYAVNAAFL